MKRIDAKCGSREYTFRTNNDGSYLFYGVLENRQISCESGFDNLKRIKKAIREHLNYIWSSTGMKAPRITYKVHGIEEFK